MQQHPVWIPLSQVALSIPSPIIPGESLTTDAVKRWTTRGVALPKNRGRVYLKARPLGAHWYTTQEWLDAFLAALAAGHDPERTTSPSPTGTVPPWGFTHEVAAHQLDRAGI